MMNSKLVLFDDFVDDILFSDIELLNGELDLLLLQHLFESINLEKINPINVESDNYFAA